MMRSYSKYLFLFVLAIGFSSCEDVIQIKLDEGSKLYVVDAFVNNLREDQKVRVVYNDSYFSNKDAPPVTNASVVLKDLTVNQQYVFNYTTNGYYVYQLALTDTISKIGHKYQLEVTIDGNVYTAVETQKRTARIDSIASLYNDGTFGPPTKDTTFNCLLFAKDKADDIPDYYWIKTYRNDTLFNAPGDINICIDGTGGAVIGSSQDSIYFTPPATFLGFKNYRRFDKCKVEVHSLSRENYFFFIQAFNQINNGGLFATTPENVKTNIITPPGAKIKAIGRFNMATVAKKEIIVK